MDELTRSERKMSPKVRMAAVFDLEGTLVDVERSHQDAHLQTAEERGLVLTREDALTLVPSFVGGPDSAVATEMCRMLNQQSKLQIETFTARKQELYRRLVKSLPVHPRLHVIEVLTALVEHHVPLALGTATEAKEGTRLLEDSNLARFFCEKHRVFADDVTRLKPHPDVYLETASRLDVEPENQIVFEDSPSGVVAAREAGCTVVAVPAVWHPSVRERLAESGAAEIVDDWEKVDLRRLGLCRIGPEDQ